MLKKFWKGVKATGLGIYRFGEWGYAKYDALPEERKDQIEDGIEKLAKEILKEMKEN